MRLRYYCDTFSEAEEKMKALKDKKRATCYGHRYSFNRACDSALSRFETLFGWLDSSKPIHNADGFRGGTQK
jgi:hypothetical protein